MLLTPISLRLQQTSAPLLKNENLVMENVEKGIDTDDELEAEITGMLKDTSTQLDFTGSQKEVTASRGDNSSESMKDERPSRV